jgi:DNA-binding transcriptional regulator YiaG
MRPDELKSIREGLGLSQQALAILLDLDGAELKAQGGRTVRRWESGESRIPGSVAKFLDTLINCPEARVHNGLILDFPSRKIVCSKEKA